MKVYRRLETPKLYANVYTETIDDEGVLSQGDLIGAASLSSMKVIIEDSTGEVVQALADMDEDSAGKFSYGGGATYYTIPATASLGVWHYECRAASATATATGRESFEVKAEVA